MVILLYVDGLRRLEAQNVYAIRLRRHGKFRSYLFELTVNSANLYYNADLSPDNQFSVLNLNDCPFPRDEIPYFELIPLSESAGRRQKEFKKAFRDFLELTSTDGDKA